MNVNLSAAGSIAILLVYGAVFWLFVWRFVRRRRAPSLAIAFVTTGWVVLALARLRLIAAEVVDDVIWIGALFGVGLLVLVTRADRVDQEDPPG